MTQQKVKGRQVSVNLNDLTDVDAPAPDTGNALVFDGNNWVPATAEDTLFVFQVGVPSFGHIHHATMSRANIEYLIHNTNSLDPVASGSQPFVVLTTEPNSNTGPQHTHDITVYFDYVSHSFVVTDITNNLLDNHTAYVVGDGSGGGTAYFNVADKAAPVDFTMSAPDFFSINVNSGEYSVTTVGTFSYGPTIVFTSVGGYQQWQATFQHQNSVESGFTLEFDVQRQLGSTGIEWVVGLQNGIFNSFGIIYTASEFRVNAAPGVDIISVLTPGLFPTNTTSINFRVVISGTSVTVYVNSVFYASGVMTFAIPVVVNVYASNLGGGVGVSPTFTSLSITGVPIAPVVNQINASPTNDTVVFPNMLVVPGSPTLVYQQVMDFEDGLNPNTYLPYPFPTPGGNPAISFTDGFIITLSQVYKDKMTIAANAITSRTLTFNGV